MISYRIFTRRASASAGIGIVCALTVAACGGGGSSGGSSASQMDPQKPGSLYSRKTR